MASLNPCFFLRWGKYNDTGSRTGTPLEFIFMPFRILVFSVIIALMAWSPRAAYGLNPMYLYTIIATEGTRTSGGEIISGIKPEVSVNEEGQVAFIGTIGDGKQLVIGREPFKPVNISQSPGGRNFDFPQINNHNRVVTRELLSGNSLIRLWNVKNPGDSKIIASSTLSAFSQLTLPTLGNTELATSPPMVGFLGRVEDLTFAYYANDSGVRDSQDLVSPLSGTTLTRFRSMAAATEKRSFVVQFSTPDDTARITVYNDIDNSGLWDGTSIASTASQTGGEWLNLGSAPGISDSGKVVAFVGDHKTDGQGIYVAIADSSSLTGFKQYKILSTDQPIAYYESGDPIRLNTVDFVNRVGVLHRELGKPGLEDDTLVLAFIATPSGSSRPNPMVPSRPLLFSQYVGIWTLRVDFERALMDPAKMYHHPTTPVPVIQVGDMLDGAKVESLTLYDPLSVPLKDLAGISRRPETGDHFIAFSVLTDAGVKVVRSAFLDTDGDGLMDHWETAGIDMDSDGTPELKLHRMGADPMHKDIFLEIDWLQDRMTGGYMNWTNGLPPFASFEMANMFANAPVSNPDGTTGITLHVDAGGKEAYAEDITVEDSMFAALSAVPDSVNMGDDPFLLEGGEKIGLESDPTAHLDVVYFGLPGLRVYGMNIRSFHDIKDKHFGQHDQWARVLAFKYALLVDFHELHMSDWGVPFTAGVASADWSSVTSVDDLPIRQGGYVVQIISGKGAGQVRVVQSFKGSRQMFLRNRWLTVPDTTSLFALIAGWGGMGEVQFLPDPDIHSRPANDFVISLGTYGVSEGGWLANADVFWRTVVHELGHTLGLRHGGSNHVNDKVDYRSLMNYKYVDELNSFAGAEDAVFNDWGYLKYDFHHTGYYFDNTFDKDPVKLAFGDPHTPDPSVVQYEEIVGHPVDLIRPTVTLISPISGSRVPFGSDLVVSLHATDDVALREARIMFDVDGDGVIDDPSERLPAADLGGGNYTATFNNIEGPYGTRGVLALAFDTSGNHGAAVATVVAGDDVGAESILHDAGGTISAQPETESGGERQTEIVGPLSVPGSGRLTFTVTSTPAVRLATEDLKRHDATVQRIQLKGEDTQLIPVCNPPGSNPAICTSYWQAPAGGSLNVEILGPSVFNADGTFMGHPEQEYELKVSFEAVDFTPPEASITMPAADGFVGSTETLVVQVTSTDDYGIDKVQVSFDINGDGLEEGVGERVTATDAGEGKYQASFSGVEGEAGARAIRVVVTDTAGLVTRVTGFVEVRVPDTTAPTVSIKSPPAGWPVEQNVTLTVEIKAYDDIELKSVTATFDIDGDGATTGPGESVTADRTGANLYTVEFQNVAGPNGPRTVNVVATDTSMNTSPASLPVTVGGVVLETETIFTDTGHIDAQPSVWSWGSQQTIDYEPVPLAGSGTVSFVVTAWPSVRALGQNISRSDPYVKNINFNDEDYNLYSSRQCNAWDEPTSICTTTFEAEEGGILDFSILGPGSWNTWGEFSGHHAQDYTIEIKFTPVDITPPEVTITSPQLGADLDLGSPLTVDLGVTDGKEVASVVVFFDVNGDGDTDDFGEQLAATHTSGDNYQTAFGPLSGAPGTRAIEVLAMDTSFNSIHRMMSVGVGGVGAGEEEPFKHAGTIPGQRSVWNGGERQIIPFGPIAISGIGRLTFRVTAEPSTRSQGENLERHDPKVVSIDFDDQSVSLTPECNEWDSDPAVCVSVWDSPGSGTLNFEILGSASYNTWGEFDGSPEQDYTVEVLFLPGPNVTEVTPNTGSVSGHKTLTVRGSGFGYNAVVLFGEVPGTNVSRVSSEELTCTTPPGVPGSSTITVLNPDPDERPWNYGVPYGLFGRLEDGFTYQGADQPTASQIERLLGTWKGYFEAVGSEDPQQQESHDFNIPGAGRIRFEAWAFVPILNPIPGPFENPDNLEWHNESTAVRRVIGGDGSGYSTQIEFSDLSYAFGPVISTATSVVRGSATGSGSFTVKGPAQWNAFYRQFGDYVMLSGPAQHWSLAVWFADQPTLETVSPASGFVFGGTAVTLTGNHFAEGIVARFGGNLATDVIVLNANTLTCRTPEGSEGTVSVEIELLGMTSSLPGGYTYLADTDLDGLPDPVEDASPCLDSNDADTDDDGIPDGVEDANQNGSVDPGEIDPCNKDTDGDGIQDGTELGYTLEDIGPDTDIGIFQPDLDPETTTDPLDSDTDNDGFPDGEEDSNHNGRVDAGEGDPGQACINHPVRIVGVPPIYFVDIQSGYDAAADGDILEVHGIVFAKDLEFDRNIAVTLKGGYDCGYATSQGITRIGSMVIRKGGVTVKGLVLE